MTKRTIENLAGLNRKFKAKAELFISASESILQRHGVYMEVISGYRSGTQQAALYAQGRTKPGKIVTKATPWRSWHNYGLAIDLGLFKNGVYLDEKNPSLADKVYAELGKLAGSMGIEWAGNWQTFQETPHFQCTFGKTLQELKIQMHGNGFDIQKLQF